MTEERNIRVQIDPRKDGRYTTTVKLVAQPLNELRAVAGGLRVLPIGRQIGEAVLHELQDVLELQQAELAQLAAEEPHDPELQADVADSQDQIEAELEALKEDGDRADEEE